MIDEPIFGVHITFSDGSNPITYYNLNLEKTCELLQQWGKDWILVPYEKVRLNDSMWHWRAYRRKEVESWDEPQPEETTLTDEC